MESPLLEGDNPGFSPDSDGANLAQPEHGWGVGEVAGSLSLSQSLPARGIPERLALDIHSSSHSSTRALMPWEVRLPLAMMCQAWLQETLWPRAPDSARAAWPVVTHFG